MTPNQATLPRLARRLFIASSLLALAACVDSGSDASPSPPPSPSPSPPTVVPVAVTPMVSAGYGFSLALKTNRTVSSWGAQDTGQLGNDRITTNSQRVPQTVMNLADARKVAIGNFHAVALRGDGTVVAWGSNADGKLGIGMIGGLYPTPQVVSGLTNVTAIAVGHDHGLALRSDKTVWAWGMNDVGQLAQSGTQPRPTPTQVPGLTDVVAIAAGGAHSMAILGDGSVWAWGWNANGQLGLGAGSASVVSTPTRVATLDGRGVVEIVGGEHHTLARIGLGAVLGWGSNLRGQTGVAAPGSGNVLVPTVIPSLLGVTALAAGASHSVALRNDGTIRTWGNAGSGRLGNDRTGAVSDSTNVPQVPNISTVTAIAAGFNHSLVLLQDGRVFCFGDNANSQCGVLGINLEFATPIEVGPGFNVNP